MQAHPIRRQAIRRRGLAEARSAEAVAPERGVRGTYKLSPERRAKGGLGCPVSHPEHGDTLTESRLPVSVCHSIGVRRQSDTPVFRLISGDQQVAPAFQSARTRRRFGSGPANNQSAVAALPGEYRTAGPRQTPRP